MLKFGTDGWRAVIADEFTFANVRLVSQAVADYLNARKSEDADHGRRGVVVGYDARFLSREFAQEVATVLANNGHDVALADRFCSSPAFSQQVVARKAALGVVITASHNPPQYNGYKIKGWYGGSATPYIVSGIEQHLQRVVAEKRHIAATQLPASVELFDPRDIYLQGITAMLDDGIIRSFQGKVFFDMMHGSAQGLATILAARYNINIEEFRGDYNPGFEGVNPEPIERYLGRLTEHLRENDCAFALATDGDGDRIGAMTSDGVFVSPHKIIAILAKYLIEKRGWSGSIVKTVTVSDLVEKVVTGLHRKLIETPVGFKYITELILLEDILLGGEESGGIGIKGYIPERDGLLLGMLLIEACAAYGCSLGMLAQRLDEQYGEFHYRRADIHLDTLSKNALIARLAEQPALLNNHATRSYDYRDGVKIRLDDGNWAMFRASGTEPVVRIYCEAATAQLAQQLLEDMVAYANQ